MLKVIDISEEKKWNDIVKSISNNDVYYLAGYVKSFQKHGDGTPQLFYYNDGQVNAINVVMKRDISSDPQFVGLLEEGKYFDLSSPYGYGGFLIDGDFSQGSLDQLFYEYEKYCKSNNIISEFVRFHPLLGNESLVYDYYNVKEIGKTVAMDLDNEELLWDNMKGKNRNVIRKAIKSGVKIFWGRDPHLFNEFIDMYNETMEKDNAKDYYYFNEDFYDSILYDLKYNSLIFYAELEGNIIAMSMILYANNNLHYHLSASRTEYLKYAPTNLLLTEVAKWGIANNFTHFHLGGGLGSSTEDGLYKFKKAFNKNSENKFHIGSKIFNKKIYNELLIKRGIDKMDNEHFFPGYRI